MLVPHECRGARACAGAYVACQIGTRVLLAQAIPVCFFFIFLYIEYCCDKRTLFCLLACLY